MSINVRGLFLALQHNRIKVQFKLSCRAVTMRNFGIFIGQGEGKYALRIMSKRKRAVR